MQGVLDRVNIATLISRMGSGVVQDHLLVGVAKYTRYEQLRKDLVEYLSAKKHLGGDNSGVHGGGRDHRGSTPMEIGSAWSKGNTGRDSINNPQEEVVAKVNIINRRANTVGNRVM